MKNEPQCVFEGFLGLKWWLVRNWGGCIDVGMFLEMPVTFYKIHGIYPEPLILAMNYGMIITGWSAEVVVITKHCLKLI